MRAHPRPGRLFRRGLHGGAGADGQPGAGGLAASGGTSGYSTDQEYLFYRTEGVRYSPRVVVLFFYYNDVLYNDRDRFAGQPKPLLADQGGRLQLVNDPVPAPTPAPQARRAAAPQGSAILEWLHDRLFYGGPRAHQALAGLGLWPPIARMREQP